MGFYVNPPTSSKEEWLKENGERTRRPSMHKDEQGRIVVCLVDNGWMTAAGVCYSQRELEAFTWAGDSRPKIFFWVPITKLKELPDLDKIEEIIE